MQIAIINRLINTVTFLSNGNITDNGDRYSYKDLYDFPKEMFYKVDNVPNEVKIGYLYENDKFIPNKTDSELQAEDIVQLKQQLTDTQLALAEIYETMLGGTV